MPTTSRQALRSGLAERLDPRLHVRLFWLWHRRWAVGELTLIRNLVAPGDVVVDIGAHRGLYSGALARVVGRTGHVHAFEPNPYLWPRLQRLADAYGNVTLHRVALSDTRGAGVLHVPRVAGIDRGALASLSGRPVVGQESSTKIPVTLATLDDYLPELGTVDFVKCDVEGHERQVLQGAHEVLRVARPYLLIEIEERHASGGVCVTVEILGRLGYEAYFVQESRCMPFADFDLGLHQTRFYDADATDPLPLSYVRNFVFLPNSRRGRQQPDAGSELPQARDRLPVNR